jgi:hypothetical protein
MTTEHERALEVLAGAALHALDERQLAEDQALLSTHLPLCLECRRAQTGFEQLIGELALAAAPRRPPRMLRSRLRREQKKRGGSRRAPVAAAAVAVALIAGMATWNAHLTSRVSRAEHRQAASLENAAELIYTVSHPKSKVVPLSEPPGLQQAQIAAAYVPGGKIIYLFGSMASPHAHHVYEVWLGSRGKFSSGGTFVPQERGLVFVRISADGSGYDTVLVTEEPGEGSDTPSDAKVMTASL